MSDTTITLYGAAGVTTVTPNFVFDGTIAVFVEDTFIQYISGYNSISLSEDEKLEYVCSDWDSITTLNIRDDKVSGDISGWTLPTDLVRFYVSNTSVSGDISDWTLPTDLVYFDVHNTSVSGDISDWTLPTDLFYFAVNNTSVSGDISDWTFPTSLDYSFIDNTSLDYDSVSGAFTGITSSLYKIDFDNCSLTRQQVDNVLADLVTSAIENKMLDIGDNNSGPGPAGWSNKETLEARDWTIKINAAVGVSIPIAAHHYKQMAGN